MRFSAWSLFSISFAIVSNNMLLAEEFQLITGVDQRLYPGPARTVFPDPGPGFPGNFYDDDRLAGTTPSGPTVTFQGIGTPFYDPNEWGSLNFVFKRGSIPAGGLNRVPLLGIDFLGGPLLDLDGDYTNGQRCIYPLCEVSPVEIPYTSSYVDLTMDPSSETITLNDLDITGNNEGAPGLQAEIATTLNFLAGKQLDGTQTGPINPAIDTRSGSLVAYFGNGGSLTGVYRIENLGFEIWQDSIDPNSSSADVLGTFQYLGEWKGWLIRRDPVTKQFPVLAGQGLGSTCWPDVNIGAIGQTYNTANGLEGGSATIGDGPAADDFTATGNGGLPLSDFGGDLGDYLDSVVIPKIHRHSKQLVYLESAGFGINNSLDPVFSDSIGYDIVLIAASARDCNNNQIPDEQDVGYGQSSDNNHNGIPDECERPIIKINRPQAPFGPIEVERIPPP